MLKSHYRPQRSCEGYVYTRVCQSFCSLGGSAIPACIPGGIPACLAAGGSAPRGCLLSGGCLLPEGSATGRCLLPGGACSWRGLLWGVACSQRGVPAPGGCMETPPNQTATVADGEHPTGMHSCLNSVFPLCLRIF